MFLSGFVYIVFFFPWALGDPENFIPANPFVTPVHIQPEWYFLFAYAILRSIPNKLGGVVALALAVVVLFFVPPLMPRFPRSLKFSGLAKNLMWTLVGAVLLLT